MKNYVLIFVFFLIGFTSVKAQKEKLNLKPYSIETTYDHLKKYHPFVTPIQELSSEDIQFKREVVYKETSTSALKLDVFYPKNSTGEKYPGVLLIHGGGWFSGIKENQAVMAQHLAEAGYVAVTASYRLGEEAKYPAAILDLKDAIRWMREHAAEFNLDTERLATLGASAGAHLAMQLGVTPDSEVYNEGNEAFSTKVQAIVNIDGVASLAHPEAEKGALLDAWLGETFKDDPALWREASPLEYVDTTSPPTIFINSAQPRFHAGRDSFVALLDKYGIYNEIHTIPNSPHSFWLLHPWFEETLKYTLDFLDKTLKEKYAEPYRIIKVAQDGTGDFKSIQEAVNSVRVFGPGEVLIKISNGVYKEKLVIPAHISKLTLEGESREKTMILNDDYASKMNPKTGEEFGTFSSYTVLVRGADVHFKNLSIKNSSCNQGQAVALHVEGDRFVAQNCNILGCQDTLYTATEGAREYFQDCYIEGTTDFIFGQATVVFNSCEIKSLADSYITAAATPRNQDFGYVFYDCKLTASDDVEKVFLGRPWRSYAKTVFLDTQMQDHITKEGWHAWPGDDMFPHKEKTAFYAEFNSSGPGASPETRVDWSHQLAKRQVEKYTYKNIFRGWIPLMGKQLKKLYKE